MHPAPISGRECADEAIQALAGDTAGDMGTGGMRTKIEAARVATEAGIKTVTAARGRRPHVVQQVVDGASARHHVSWQDRRCQLRDGHFRIAARIELLRTDGKRTHILAVWLSLLRSPGLRC